MRALLDINVLIALLDLDHPDHPWAKRWFKSNVQNGWASCPLTQNGCIRIMSQPAYPNSVPVSIVMELLRNATGNAAHAFWPDAVSLLDSEAVDGSLVHGPRQVTDVYLLALAVQNGGRFVTFDGAIALAAVRKAKPEHLHILTAG